MIDDRATAAARSAGRRRRAVERLALLGPGVLAWAALGMAAAHASMVAVMVMTPLHMKHGHTDLRLIGLVISLHVLGMYAFSPLVGRLVDAGFLERVEGRIAPTKKFFARPVLGSVRAGLPQPVQQDPPELITLDDYLIDDPNRTSVIKVRGDSMKDAGIFEGDLVIVDHYLWHQHFNDNQVGESRLVRVHGAYVDGIVQTARSNVRAFYDRLRDPEGAGQLYFAEKFLPQSVPEALIQPANGVLMGARQLVLLLGPALFSVSNDEEFAQALGVPVMPINILLATLTALTVGIIGISIAVNRHPGARCALVSDPYSAALAREPRNCHVGHALTPYHSTEPI